jgi:uncharacterized protein (DUF1330 family)
VPKGNELIAWSDRERDVDGRKLVADAYRLSAQHAQGPEWDAFLARAGTAEDGPVTVIEIDRLRDGQRPRHDSYVAAITAAARGEGGEPLAVVDVVTPGTGDLVSYEGYAGGVAVLLTFPSRAAFLAALASETWRAGSVARSDAVGEAIIFVAGANSIPPAMAAMLGEPRMAASVPTPRVDGKTPDQLVDELLAIYPDGGADPSRAQLERMTRFPGFRDQPVHYINLYAFGSGDDPAVKGAAAHDAYNQAALQSVLPHGAYPLYRADVELRIASEIPWSRVIFVRWPSLAVFTDLRLDPDYVVAQRHRVESAETYGNFVTIKRED